MLPMDPLTLEALQQHKSPDAEYDSDEYSDEYSDTGSYSDYNESDDSGSQSDDEGESNTGNMTYVWTKKKQF